MKTSSRKSIGSGVPFEMTPVVQRYVEELMWLIDEYFAGENDNQYLVANYESDEVKTPRAERNRKAFWDYLVESGVVWCGADDIKTDNSKIEHQAVRILKAEPIRQLSKTTKVKSANKNKVAFNPLTKVLSFGEMRHKFQEGNKRKVFEILFDRYVRDEGPLEGERLAIQAKMINDRNEFFEVQGKLNQLVNDINVILKKGFPMFIERGNGNYEMVGESKKL